MLAEPRTRYLDLDEGRLAYQLVGDGSAGHVVWYQELNAHLDLCWTDPSLAAGIDSHTRDGLVSVMLQSRGIGLSDPVARQPTVEQQAADLLAVMDAEGIPRATLVANGSLCPAAALIAARQPERVHGLVLYGTGLTGPAAGGEETGWTAEEARRCLDGYAHAVAEWGSGHTLAMYDPALDSPYNRRLIAMTERCSASQATARAYTDRALAMDGRAIYPQVAVPTRVLRVVGQSFPEATSRKLAEAIPAATHHELPPSVLGDSMGDAWHGVFRHVAEVALGPGPARATGRILASVLFTDIVGSTEHLARLGDGAWSAVLDRHERLVRREVTQAGGRVVKLIGDGTLSEFPGPVAAVRCAQAICAGAPALGVEVRAGVHTGECERRGDDLAGLAVHIGARVCALAGPGEVLASRTVRDLVAGSGLAFRSRGEHELKGVGGRWELHRLAAPAPAAQAAAPGVPTAPTAIDRAVMRVARSSPGAMRAASRLGSALQRRRLSRSAAARARSGA